MVIFAAGLKIVGEGGKSRARPQPLTVLALPGLHFAAARIVFRPPMPEGRSGDGDV